MSSGGYGDRSWADQERRSWTAQEGAAGPDTAQRLERHPLADRGFDTYLDGPYEKPKYGRPWCGL